MSPDAVETLSARLGSAELKLGILEQKVGSLEGQIKAVADDQKMLTIDQKSLVMSVAELRFAMNEGQKSLTAVSNALSEFRREWGTYREDEQKVRVRELEEAAKSRRGYWYGLGVALLSAAGAVAAAIIQSS